MATDSASSRGDSARPELDELTDGVLILRFLFGFTGTTLTDDATARNCMRCDASTILPYLQTLD